MIAHDQIKNSKCKGLQKLASGTQVTLLSFKKAVVNIPQIWYGSWNGPCAGPAVGPNYPHVSLLIQNILWFYDKFIAKEGNTELEPFTVTQNQCWYKANTVSSPQLLKPCPKIILVTLVLLQIKNHLHFIDWADNFSITPFSQQTSLCHPFTFASPILMSWVFLSHLSKFSRLRTWVSAAIALVLPAILHSSLPSFPFTVSLTLLVTSFMPRKEWPPHSDPEVMTIT